MQQTIHDEVSRLWALKDGPWIGTRGNPIGSLFKASVNRMLSRCNEGSWTAQDMRQLHGINFMFVLPELPTHRDPTLWDYYEIGSQRILLAAQQRHLKQIQLFRQIHDDLGVFLSFQSYVLFRYPNYDFEQHPSFKYVFNRFFHRALMALVNWKAPVRPATTLARPPRLIQWKFVAPRDASPVRRQ